MQKKKNKINLNYANPDTNPEFNDDRVEEKAYETEAPDEGKEDVIEENRLIENIQSEFDEYSDQ